MRYGLGWRIIKVIKECENRFLKTFTIPLALWAAEKTLTEGVNAEFTVMTRSFIGSQDWSDPPSDRTRLHSEGPHIGR